MTTKNGRGVNDSSRKEWGEWFVTIGELLNIWCTTWWSSCIRVSVGLNHTIKRNYHWKCYYGRYHFDDCKWQKRTTEREPYRNPFSSEIKRNTAGVCPPRERENVTWTNTHVTFIQYSYIMMWKKECHHMLLMTKELTGDSCQLMTFKIWKKMKKKWWGTNELEFEDTWKCDWVGEWGCQDLLNPATDILCCQVAD